MTGEVTWEGEGAVFLRAFLDEDAALLDMSIDCLGNWRVGILTSCLLAVVMRDRFGEPITLDVLSSYAKKIHSEMPKKQRRIVIECALRTGAGYDGPFAGLPDDEALEVTIIVLRWICRDLRMRSTTYAGIADRAVRLAVEGNFVET